MQEITRVNHLGVRVSDLAKSRSFYEKLGFKFIAGPVGPEPVAIMEHPSGINVNFILNTNINTEENLLMDIEEKHTGYTHVALEVSNANNAIEKLMDADIPLSGGPMAHPTGTSIFIRDPDKNVIEFVEYKGLGAFTEKDH